MKYNMSLGLLDYYCGHNTMGRKKIPDNIPELSTSEWKSLIDDRMLDGDYSRRGRMNAKRDSMGRYSGDAAMDELRTMMNEGRDETKRRKIQSIIQPLE